MRNQRVADLDAVLHLRKHAEVILRAGEIRDEQIHYLKFLIGMTSLEVSQLQIAFRECGSQWPVVG